MKYSNKIVLTLIGGLFLTGCTANQTTNTTLKGAGIGTALGAGTGAIVGATTGNAGRGVAIGAGLGALGGTLVGYGLGAEDNKRSELEQRQLEQQLEIERQRREIEELRRGTSGDYNNGGNTNYNDSYDDSFDYNRRY